MIREAGGDRSAVTGGTRLLSDQLVVQVTQEPGQSFLDRMIALVEGAERRKTPNEVALNILLAGLTITFLAAVVTLKPFAAYAGTDVSTTVLIALLIALIPTTIGALALGDRHRRHGPPRPAERPCDVRPCGRGIRRRRRPAPRQDRHDHARQPAGFRVHPGVGVDERELAEVAQLSSLADETPEGRSIVVLAKERYGLRERELHDEARFIPFSATTRMSGVDMDGKSRARARWTPSRRSCPRTAARRRPSSTASCADRASPAGRRSPSPRTTGCSA